MREGYYLWHEEAIQKGLEKLGAFVSIWQKAREK